MTPPPPGPNRPPTTPTYRRLRSTLIAADAVAVVLGLAVGHVLLRDVSAVDSPVGVVPRYALLAAVWLASMSVNRLYTTRCVERLGEEIRRLFVAGAASVAAVVAFTYIVGAALPARSLTVGLFATVTMALLIERTIARYVFGRLRQSGALTRRIAIVGFDDHAAALARSLQENPSLGYSVAGFVGAGARTEGGEFPVLGGFDRVDDVLVENGCVGGIISVASLGSGQLNTITRRLVERGLHVAVSTNLCDIDASRMRPQSVDGEVLLYVEPASRTGWRATSKRILDLVVSFVVMVITLPVIVIAIVMLKLDSRGPILFRQERVGRNGERFQMLKLRTMCVDAELRRDEVMSLNEAGGPMFKIKHDPRVTRVGRVLRRLSIDELPQFWNVVRGDMSVVGPRPALPHEMDAWDPELHKRLSVLPGITGMWQVSGRSNTSFEQYRRLDLYYVDNWSLTHDLQVIAKTVWVVLSARGAS